ALPTLLTGLVPNLLGNPITHNYNYMWSNYNEQIVYYGVLTLSSTFLAIIYLFRQKHYKTSSTFQQDHRLFWFFLFLCVTSMGVACHIPVFNIINHLPLFNIAMNSRLRLIYIFAGSILGGFGMELFFHSGSANSEFKLKDTIDVQKYL